MRKSLVAPVVVWGMVSLAQAQTPATTPAASAPPTSTASAVVPTKVAIINIQQAILSTGDGKKAADALRTKFDARKAALDKRSADLRAKVETLRKGGSTMSDEARAKLVRDNDAENKAIQRDGEDFNNDMEQEQGRLMDDIGHKMIEIIGQYAGANGYAMVLNVSEQSPLLWHNPSTDITADIIKLYDQAHPASAAPAKPPTPAPPPGKKQ